MIPIEVENRIAKYFFHHFLPEEVMEHLVALLLPLCLEADEEEDLDQDELVRLAVSILEARLEGKSIK
ncbi:hypothetical protein [Salipaludibacillus aurantiacus]|uniref:Uncharacterized protein n=1 Tax=Salipaludibacillus aurantiacus TaxID=1601833 RepID=A0A1H9XB56_9BACI|nr:hypothetical protein [Salipaludibacillus aurantiacus]SES43365.1 hypothetical protein SAMN05518684_1353 [Salipaludibacillus aurantiacus]